MRTGRALASWLFGFGTWFGMNPPIAAAIRLQEPSQESWGPRARPTGTGSSPGPTHLVFVGHVLDASGSPAVRVAKWDGASWAPLGSGMNHTVYSFCEYDDGGGGGPALYAAGDFSIAGGVSARRIARWDGTSWSSLGNDFDPTVETTVYALASFAPSGGVGATLYAAGTFLRAGGAIASRIAHWDGSTWSALDDGINRRVRALASAEDGSLLYAGGFFNGAGGQTVNRIASWDGTSWSALGSGLSGGGSTEVFALAVFDEGLGAGPCLFAGGNFTSAGGVSASRIARWDGTAWSDVGGGLGGMGSLVVNALEVYDDGTGPGLVRPKTRERRL